LKKFKTKADSPDTIEYKIGEKIYDGAVGSAGFLVEAYNYLISDKAKLSTSEIKTIQKNTLLEKKKNHLLI